MSPDHLPSTSPEKTDFTFIQGRIWPKLRGEGEEQWRDSRGRWLFFKTQQVPAPWLDFSPHHVRPAGCWQAEQAQSETCQRSRTTHRLSAALQYTGDFQPHIPASHSPALPFSRSLHGAPMVQERIVRSQDRGQEQPRQKSHQRVAGPGFPELLTGCAGPASPREQIPALHLQHS